MESLLRQVQAKYDEKLSEIMSIDTQLNSVQVELSEKKKKLNLLQGQYNELNSKWNNLMKTIDKEVK